MDIQNFLSDSLNAKLAILLVSSPLSVGEKEKWLAAAYHMTKEQKERLIENLQSEIASFVEVEKKMFEKVESEIAKK